MSTQSLATSPSSAISRIPAGARSVSLFRHGTLELKISLPLAPNVQTPHVQDELYFIVRGNGVLFHGGERSSFGTGDVLFVAAGVEHHFEDFSEDLLIWVVFY